jgi:hypothetical protein
MAPAPSLINTEEEHPGTKNLSIEIEPSYPLIMATIQFFRSQKKPRQTLELCRRGLAYFPGNLGLRIGLALAYLDLSEKDKAWVEFKEVTRELEELAPLLEYVNKHFQHIERNYISEWFDQLSKTLLRYPEESFEEKKEILTPSFFPNEALNSFSEIPVCEKSPHEDLEAKAFSQVFNEEPLSIPGHEKNEEETARESLGNPKVLSTLTNWLSQLKGNKI